MPWVLLHSNRPIGQSQGHLAPTSGQSGIQRGYLAVRSREQKADHPISTGQNNSTNGRSPLRWSGIVFSIAKCPF